MKKEEETPGLNTCGRPQQALQGGRGGLVWRFVRVLGTTCICRSEFDRVADMPCLLVGLAAVRPKHRDFGRSRLLYELLVNARCDARPDCKLPTVSVGRIVARLSSFVFHLSSCVFCFALFSSRLNVRHPSYETGRTCW